MTSRAKVWAEFSKMRIDHDRLAPAHKTFDDLRQVARDTPGEPQRFASMFAETHSGKTMCVRTYLEGPVAQEAIDRGLFPADMDRQEIAKRQRIVLYIVLEGVTNIKTLAQEILLAMGVSATGNTNQLLKLAYDHLKKLKVELLIIDEMQHIKTAKERAKFADEQTGETALTNTLKTVLIRGVCPMVFVGLTKARYLIFNDDQLADRCLEEIDFSELDMTNNVERMLFFDYCGMIGLKMKKHGLFEEDSDMLHDDIPGCLYAVSGGKIGIVSRLVEQAAVVAIDKGSPCVLREHLEAAVDKWAIPKKLIDYNPFKSGVRRVKRI